MTHETAPCQLEWCTLTHPTPTPAKGIVLHENLTGRFIHDGNEMKIVASWSEDLGQRQHTAPSVTVYQHRTADPDDSRDVAFDLQTSAAKDYARILGAIRPADVSEFAAALNKAAALLAHNGGRA